MSSQSSKLESSALGNQAGGSVAKKEEPKQEKMMINLPIEGINPFKFPSSKMELSFASGSSIQAQNLEFKKKPLQQKSLLKKPLLQGPYHGLFQATTSAKEWEWHFKNTNTEDTFPGCDQKTTKVAQWRRVTKVKKMGVKKLPMKHKTLVQKRKIFCLPGKSKTKSLAWTKGILQIKEEYSNLLRKPKLLCHQKNSKVNFSEWIKDIPNIPEDNSNWVRTADVSLDFKALNIEGEAFSDPERAYDMKALADECKNMEVHMEYNKDPPILRSSRVYNFQNLINECEHLEEDICEARSPPNETPLCQNSDEGNANELAGYLDNMLHIPKEISDSALSIYT